ncbi:hypothetical protein WKR88_28985 [Trinickia caryophylli]|uniref:Uncharacterized protein n=1 Tax=Trinickia caryophylli TaxID=28094 RepID=A0A1X7H2K8_TRICW|nr:hypothetical protein [Trinickia caryophylli]PMS10049.1 hypothetical protein C0Z17_22355 [Trinickia caryophylli]TRX18407.1 hypothetical protein FNF07_09385 [Trinickia caryophylli]WQE10809.1 hypothetical protein U0034_13545 [Trinickia caryophylli]SMF78697.1 hypothetical protein SAMN06295900_120131 [Trinickia caryophylli]GLU35885.1 hypothetical protein Busp01_57270 [Trinickia caryophylli]
MTIDELRAHLRHLINAYVQDAATRVRLLDLVERDDVPAKGILAELTPLLPNAITADDANIIKDIAFYFC